MTIYLIEGLSFGKKAWTLVAAASSADALKVVSKKLTMAEIIEVSSKDLGTNPLAVQRMLTLDPGDFMGTYQAPNEKRYKMVTVQFLVDEKDDQKARNMVEARYHGWAWPIIDTRILDINDIDLPEPYAKGSAFQ